jgi:hypothetical protein
MFIDFGVAPSEVKRMSMAEMHGTMRRLSERTKKTGKMPTRSEEEAATEAFAKIVANDPTVRLN